MRGGNRRGIAGKDPPLVIFPPSGIVAGAARMKESPGRKIREGRWESMTIRYQPRGVCAPAVRDPRRKMESSSLYR